MKKRLSSVWAGWKKLGLIIGNFISTVVMLVFYFTFFALVAIPFRIFSQNKEEGDTNFIVRKSTISTLKEFESE